MKGLTQITELEEIKSALCCAITEIKKGNIDLARSFTDEAASELVDVSDELRQLQNERL